MSDLDPYLAMGPLHAAGEPPAPQAPAAEPEDTAPDNDDVDDGSLDFRTPEREDAAIAEEPDSPDGEDRASEGAEDPDEIDDDQQWLIERAQKADEYERELARLRSETQEQQAVALWDARLDQANTEFARREDVIFANAEQSLNPVAYLRTEMAKLTNEANSWYAAYRDQREQALWQFAHAQAIPNHAARVVEHYKLPQEAIEELLEYAPELMEREAQKMRARLIKERKQAKAIDQLKRKTAARDLAATTVAPGTGRGTGGGEMQLGSDEHYFSIPWTRGR